MAAPLVEFLDTFERADEQPVSTNGWDGARVDLLDGTMEPTTVDAVALQEVTTANSPDQLLELFGGSIVENLAATTISSATVLGAVVTYTLASAHGRPDGLSGKVTISGANTTTLDGTYTCVFSGSTDVIVDYGSAASPTAPYGTMSSTDAHFCLLARLPANADTSNFQPPSGYQLRLSYNTGGVRQIEIWKADSSLIGESSGTFEQIATAIVTSKMNQDHDTATDLGMLQKLRFTLVNKDSVVYLKGYLNNEDDDSPDITVIDRGEGSEVGDFNITHKDAGIWGLEMGAGGIAVEQFYAVDRYSLPQEDSSAGKTLAELRVDLGYELARGNLTGLSDAEKDYYIEQGMWEVKGELGTLIQANRFMEEMTFTFDQQRNTEIPDSIEFVEGLYHTATQAEVPFRFLSRTKSQGLRLHVPSAPTGTTDTYLVFYMPKWVAMQETSDVCPLPREHSEAITLAAALRLTSRATDQGWVQGLMIRYRSRISTIKKEMNRIRGMEKVSFGVRRRFSPRGRDRHAPSGDKRLLFGRSF